MKNGYYLSAYCCIDEEGCILNAQIRHDQSIALWELNDNKVKLIKYWELERLTREKQHMKPFLNINHFINVVDYLLKEVNVKREEINAIFGMPEFTSDIDYLHIPHKYNLPFHSISHMFSALIDTNIQFKSKQLILAVDGGPDNLLDKGFDKINHYSAGYFDNGELVDIVPISSPAYMWAEASDKFKLKEGTLMALAEACECDYDSPEVDIKLDKFLSMWDIPKLRKEFERVWAIIENTNLKMDKRFSVDENKISCMMKKIQKFSKNMMVNEINSLISKFNIKPENTIISITGGFALNCPTNTYIMEKFHFKQFISPPCVNDSGMSLGIGLLSFYTMLGKKMSFCLNDAYYGHNEKNNYIDKKYNKYIKKKMDFNINQFIKDINENPVCWFEGNAEIGPRALGHRSILGTATTQSMKDKLNKIKQRQWWRPVAPIILSECINDWCTPAIESPFMLHAVKIKKDKQKKVPAILHLNNSARIQTIDSNNSFYSILKQYYQKTGIPIICNTSLNDKGEPIINTYDELMNFALRKKIKVIYVNRVRYELINFNLFRAKKPLKENNPFDSYLRKNKSLKSKYSDIFIDDETLDFYTNHKEYFKNINLKSNNLRQEVERIKKNIYENISS